MFNLFGWHCCGWYHFPFFGYFGSYGWLGLIINIGIFIIAFGVILWLIKLFLSSFISPKNSSYRYSKDYNKEEAMRILDIEFAKGNITEEEYLKRKNLILKN